MHVLLCCIAVETFSSFFNSEKFETNFYLDAGVHRGGGGRAVGFIAKFDSVMSKLEHFILAKSK